ncbi:formylglycine-generating enzyme family protein [Streptomyces sp. DK15]|uniref:SUMF1/EgtB/PvdO family nonheme iron enzyme n=1 Tax=Streptomyces sp. DK15 TaxID=2957499 RepID=UPI0029B31A7B|nr:SUMF1/EgtB/PvdO family nonheme iron enzyme [Streptomyces sp. DK15]MDX2396424.1 formylglycine-generating enzyme family protein [Streptomyces sp. DK15]
MGAGDPDPFPADHEGPVRKVGVEPFRITPTTVANARFATFVEATGHPTEAEPLASGTRFAGGTNGF